MEIYEKKREREIIMWFLIQRIQRESDRDTDRERQTDTERDKQTDRERQTDRQRETNRQTDRKRKTDRHRQRYTERVIFLNSKLLHKRKNKSIKENDSLYTINMNLFKGLIIFMFFKRIILYRYIFDGDKVEIKVQFTAKPWPQVCLYFSQQIFFLIWVSVQKITKYLL